MTILNRTLMLIALILFTSCLDEEEKKKKDANLVTPTENKATETEEDIRSSVLEKDSLNTSVIEPEVEIQNIEDESTKAETDKSSENATNEIPPDGKYIFDISYAEYQGRTMGEKVLVVIKGTSITIISEGNPSMTAAKGEILDKGTLIRHIKTGEWLISTNPSDADLEVYGDCAGDIMVIDFKNKTYLTC